MIPVEILTMAGGALLSTWQEMGRAKDLREAARDERDARKTEAAEKSFESARQYQGGKVSNVRRWISLTGVLSIFLLYPLMSFVAAWVGFDWLTTITYTEFTPGGWFSEDREVIKSIVTDGNAVTPLHTNFVAFIAGHYLGTGRRV